MRSNTGNEEVEMLPQPVCLRSMLGSYVWKSLTLLWLSVTSRKTASRVEAYVSSRGELGPGHELCFLFGLSNFIGLLSLWAAFPPPLTSLRRCRS